MRITDGWGKGRASPSIEFIYLGSHRDLHLVLRLELEKVGNYLGILPVEIQIIAGLVCSNGPSAHACPQ